MSNRINPSQEQFFDSPQYARMHTVAEGRFGMQQGILGLYPQLTAQIAAESALQAFAKIKVEQTATEADADRVIPPSDADESTPPDRLIILDGNEVDEASSREAYVRSLQNEVAASYIQMDEEQRAA